MWVPLTSLIYCLRMALYVPIDKVSNVDELASILGCRVSSLPMKYLGLPLGASFKAKSIWDGIIEKMELWLASWKRMYLSKGEMITLIKSTLSNMPTYFISPFPLATSVTNQIEKLQRDLLWGGIGKEFKFHLVSSTKVCYLIGVPKAYLVQLSSLGEMIMALCA
jgi:hypothetical protein